jgi:sulfate/thiosulfate transport system permease protein
LLLVILPISYLVFHATQLDLNDFISSVTNDRVLAAYQLTITVALGAAIINIILGLLISWTLVRYDFFGKSILEMFVDLPLALPTAIAGLILATIYSPGGAFGKILSKLGIQVAFTNLGILMALILVGLPLAVRTLEPIIREIDSDVESAAYGLGASGLQVFLRVYLPGFMPSIISAFSICFARALSEYGAVIFIASNIPKESEIVSMLIYSKIEQFDYNEATAIALVMLLLSFFILWAINAYAKRWII